MTTPTRIQYNGQAWSARLAQLATAKLDVVICQECGSPRHRPHICVFCGGE